MIPPDMQKLRATEEGDSYRSTARAGPAIDEDRPEYRRKAARANYFILPALRRVSNDGGDEWGR